MGRIGWWEVFLTKYEDDESIKISDTLKMTIPTIHYLLQMEEDLILYKDKT